MRLWQLGVHSVVSRFDAACDRACLGSLVARCPRWGPRDRGASSARFAARSTRASMGWHTRRLLSPLTLWPLTPGQAVDLPMPGISWAVPVREDPGQGALSCGARPVRRVARLGRRQPRRRACPVGAAGASSSTPIPTVGVSHRPSLCSTRLPASLPRRGPPTTALSMSALVGPARCWKCVPGLRVLTGIRQGRTLARDPRRRIGTSPSAYVVRSGGCRRGRRRVRPGGRRRTQL
jgi:hypothetical protein